jgi:hypothetical protein
MANVDDNIAAYDAMREKLESGHMGKWVLFCDRELVSVFDSFEQAAESAVEKFGRGPYLIRQIGAPALALPASAMYNPGYGSDQVRVR